MLSMSSLLSANVNFTSARDDHAYSSISIFLWSNTSCSTCRRLQAFYIACVMPRDLLPMSLDECGSLHLRIGCMEI